jgi:hypothetical protein
MAFNNGAPKPVDINDNKLPDLYLKYYKDMSGNSLSLVDISQRGVEYSTTLTVTPNTCSTLKSGLYGFYVGNEENKVLLSNTLDTDPFFNTETILTLTSRGTVTVELEVQHTINAPYYIIPCVNKPGDQISFDSSLYKFNLSDPTHCAFLDENFNPYTTMWLPYENLDIRTPLLSNFSLNMGLTLYYNDSLIIDMSQANVINNDFNIIRCLNPLVRVDTTLHNLPNGSYLTAYRNYVSALTELNRLLKTITFNRYKGKFIENTDDGLYNANMWDSIISNNIKIIKHYDNCCICLEPTLTLTKNCCKKHLCFCFRPRVFLQHTFPPASAARSRHDSGGASAARHGGDERHSGRGGRGGGEGKGRRAGRCSAQQGEGEGGQGCSGVGSQRGVLLLGGRPRSCIVTP